MQDFLEFGLYLRNDGRRCGASVTRLELYTVPAIRIVARRDLNSTGSAALANEQGNRGRGTSLVRKPYGHSRRGKSFRRHTREPLRAKPRVVSHQDFTSRLFGTHHVARNRVRHFADILFRKIFGDHAAPSIGAKFNINRLLGRLGFVSIRQELSPLCS